MLQIIWKCLFQILERNRAFIAWFFVLPDEELTMMRMSVEASRICETVFHSLIINLEEFSYQARKEF